VLDGYIYEIKRAHIHINQVEDELTWVFNDSGRDYSANLGYQASVVEDNF
jgi:hypothetical protein